MPRLKLPEPAKRRAQAHRWAKRNKPLEPGTRAAYDGFRAGYAAALREVHKIRNVEARARWRRSWRIADTHRLELESLRRHIDKLQSQLSDFGASLEKAGGTD